MVGKSRWLGYNDDKGHPAARKTLKYGEESCCIHAEMDALVKIPQGIRHKVKLYVFRFLKNGSLSMAKPCDLCSNFLKEHGISSENVFYTDWSGNWVSLS